MTEIGRLLLGLGLTLTAVGLVFLVIGKWFPSVGQFPGTVRYEGENFKVYMPVGLMILLSLVGTLVLNVIFRLFR